MADVDCTVRTCSKCAESLPLEHFYPRADRPGKRRSWCRACLSKLNKGLGYYSRNKARLLADASARYASGPQLKERASAHKKSPRGMAARLARESTPGERLAKRIRSQLLRALRGGKGGAPSAELLGWVIADLASHLELQFTAGMGWHNMGEWHIDHIVPTSSFAITGADDPEIRRVWSLSNLRPLWAAENLRKGATRTHLI